MKFFSFFAYWLLCSLYSILIINKNMLCCQYHWNAEMNAGRWLVGVWCLGWEHQNGIKDIWTVMTVQESQAHPAILSKLSARSSLNISMDRQVTLFIFSHLFKGRAEFVVLFSTILCSQVLWACVLALYSRHTKVQQYHEMSMYSLKMLNQRLLTSVNVMLDAWF